MVPTPEMDRRAMLQSLGLLIGAAALPVEALAAPRRGARGFLTPARMALLSAVADTIMPVTDTPGALAAKVPARIDGLLANWASAATRTSVTGALDRIDAAARAQKGKRFAALTKAERVAVLTPHDAAALKKVPPPPGAAAPSLFSPRVDVADVGYHKIKDMTIGLFYFSEVGVKNELEYVHVPGKFQPSIKLTPQSRPYLGTGPF